jgi:phospholipid N-methyltransferase
MSLPTAPKRVTRSLATGTGRLQLLTAFAAHPRAVGAVAPTSARTVRHMLDMADIPSARSIVELGAGTGPFTRELARRMSAAARLVAFEIDGRLAADLRREITDPRITIRDEPAERLPAVVTPGSVDVIVSALPLTSLPADVRRAALSAIVTSLRPDGVLLAIQYSNARRADLESCFADVRRRTSVLNVPPAQLFACRWPKPGTTPR